jgi:hypothetical protein
MCGTALAENVEGKSSSLGCVPSQFFRNQLLPSQTMRFACVDVA